MEDDIEYRLERGAFERMGQGDVEVEFVRLRDINNPQDKFKALVRIITSRLRNEGGVPDGYTDGDYFAQRDKMLKYSSSFDKHEYLNPGAYILGFFASRSPANFFEPARREPDKQLFQSVIYKYMIHLDDDTTRIDKALILKYARQWVIKGL